MDLTPLSQLQHAFATGAVYLVDEHARPVTFGEAMGQRCWARLRDAQDGKEYVHELKGSGDLLQPNYQELLGLIV